MSDLDDTKNPLDADPMRWGVCGVCAALVAAEAGKWHIEWHQVNKHKQVKR